MQSAHKLCKPLFLGLILQTEKQPREKENKPQALSKIPLKILTTPVLSTPQ